MLSFYKVVKETKIELPETSLEELLKLRPSNLVKYKELRKVCRNSDAALISWDSSTLFVSLKKVSPSIQLLKVPAVVKEVLVAKVMTDSNFSKDSESGFASLKLKTEKLELSEELIAFDSVLKGELGDSIYALKIVSDKLDSVIIKDEITKYLNKQSKQLKTPRKKRARKKRKKSKKLSRRKRKKTTKKSR
ncbi:MAG: hypothetical protein ACP5KB_05125 [Thermoprotei archaeon]